MDVQKILHYPNAMTESLDPRKLMPITCLRIIDLKKDLIVHLVASTSHDKHQRSLEDCTVLYIRKKKFYSWDSSSFTKNHLPDTEEWGFLNYSCKEL